MISLSLPEGIECELKPVAISFERFAAIETEARSTDDCGRIVPSKVLHLRIAPSTVIGNTYKDEPESDTMLNIAESVGSKTHGLIELNWQAIRAKVKVREKDARDNVVSFRLVIR